MKFSLTEETKYKLHEIQKAAAGYRSNGILPIMELMLREQGLTLFSFIFNADGSFKIIQLYKFVLLSLTLDISLT